MKTIRIDFIVSDKWKQDETLPDGQPLVASGVLQTGVALVDGGGLTLMV